MKVLLAHDDELMRDALRDALKSHHDIQVLATVDDGRKAVDQAVHVAPDVVVAGLSIPIMDGIEVARAVVERKHDVAVLLISKDDPGSTILRAFRAGARGYLLETSALAEFVQALRAVAGGERYLGAGVMDRLFDSLRASHSDLDALSRLSAMERQILRLVAEGKSNAEAANILSLSPRTVETYRSDLMRKLGLSDVSSLVKFAIRQGITGID